MTTKALFLTAPSGQLDPAMKPLIEKWNDTPTAIQILEVLDNCVYSGSASTFTVKTLEYLLTNALDVEGKKYEDIVAAATWRKEL